MQGSQPPRGSRLSCLSIRVPVMGEASLGSVLDRSLLTFMWAPDTLSYQTAAKVAVISHDSRLFPPGAVRVSLFCGGADA